MYIIRTAFQELAVSTHRRLQATCCPNTQRAFPARVRQSSPLYSCASPLHEIQKISLDPFLLLQLMWLQKSDLLTIGFTFPQCLWASFPHTACLCWAPSEPKGVHALGLLHLELAKPSMVARHKRKQPQLCTSSSTVSLHCKWTKRHKSSSRCILSFWIV